MRSLLIICLLLAPLPALAGWSRTNLNPGSESYYDFTTETDPPRIRTSQCGPGSSVRFVAKLGDTTGAATNTATIKVHACARFTGTGAGGCRQWYDTSKATGTLNGDPTTGQAVFYGPMGTWMYIDVIGTPAAGTSRVEILCK